MMKNTCHIEFCLSYSIAYIIILLLRKLYLSFR